MNFWQFIQWASGYTTRILGVATGTLVTLTGTGIIPDSQLKYWMAAIAILTYWRGHAVSSTVAQAKAIVAQKDPTIVPFKPEQKII